MTKSILITGASGTVGKAAGEYLCSQGYDVIGASRSVRDDHPCYSRTVQLDLLKEDDIRKLEEVLDEVDAVFHLAWNIPEENFDTHSAWEGNIEMYHNIMDASISAGVPVFINGSSIHAGTGGIPAYTVDADLEATPEPYRRSIDPDSDQELRKEQPEKLLDPREKDPDSPYGWSKVMSEKILREAVERGDFRMGISIRIGGVNEHDTPEMENEPFFSSLYWSHTDLGRTIADILDADLSQKAGYHQFYGVSDNPGRIFSIENAFTGQKKVR